MRYILRAGKERIVFFEKSRIKIAGLKKSLFAGAALSLAALLTSCLSANFLFEDYSVPITEPYETVKARAEKIVAETLHRLP